MAVYGSVEGGGTKFVCAVGSSPVEIVAEATIPTTTPDATLGRVIDFFSDHGPMIEAIGVAMFGPLDLDAASRSYGHVTSTPKPGWSGVDIVGGIEAGFGVPVGFDTDVNGAALGEGRWGAGRGLETFIYITIGTGVGGGGVVNGHPLHGLVHPEIGHLRIPRLPGDEFPGACPYHRDCLEGLVAGPAIEARWGRPAQDLGGDTAKAVELAAHSLGHAMANLVLAVSPQRIIIGGGVAKLPGLLDATRERMVESLGGYIASPEIENGAIDYLVPPGLGDRAGIAGGFVLAERAVAPVTTEAP